MLVNSRFPSSFVSKSGKFKKILGGGGGGREGMPLKTLTFLFTEKKKNQKLCVLKKK